MLAMCYSSFFMREFQQTFLSRFLSRSRMLSLWDSALGHLPKYEAKTRIAMFTAVWLSAQEPSQPCMPRMLT